MTELAQRAVACPGFRWLPGMLAKHPNFRGFRVSHVGTTAVAGRVDVATSDARAVVALPLPTSSDVLPDLTDPATLGCLLALVREAWGDPTLHVWYSRQLGLWVVSASGQEIGVQETTDREALVTALEAAP